MSKQTLEQFLQSIGADTCATLTQSELVEKANANGFNTNAGRMSTVLKNTGFSYKSARGNGAKSATAQSDKSKGEGKLFWSKEFAEVMRQLVSRGFIQSVGIIANDDGTVGFDRSVAIQVEKQFDAAPIDADFAFIVRHVPDGDWSLAGIETPTMRKSRIDADKIKSDQLESAKKLVQASGYQLVKPESSSLIAQFMAREAEMIAEQSAIACQSIRSGLAQQWRNERRQADILKARRSMENKEAQQTQLHTATLVAEDLQAAADQRIASAIKAANDALAAKQASEEALIAMQAQMAVMQAQMAAIMQQQSKPQGKPQLKQ